MNAPQPCDAIPSHRLPLLIPTSPLTLLFTTQLALMWLRLPQCLELWTPGYPLVSPVGRTEKENKILLGSQPAEQVEKAMFAYCPLWPVSQPAGRLHCGPFLEDSLSPES